MNDKTLDQVEKKIAKTPKRGGGRKLTVTTPVVKTGPLINSKIQPAWVLAPPWKVAN